MASSTDKTFIGRKRPRVSLISGSALVLVSLVLPFTYDSCGAVKTGSEFLTGQGAWPGLAVFASDWASRGFYALTLGFAAFTVALAVFSFVRPLNLQGTRLSRWGYAVAGALSLFVISNLASSVVSSWVLEGAHARTLYAVSILYWLAPTALWCRFGLSSEGSMKARWSGMRSRIFLLYLPAVAIDTYVMLAVILGGLWGFVTFFFGIQMLALGYMRMARTTKVENAETVSATENVVANYDLDAVPVA
jgi:hypothetical protein